MKYAFAEDATNIPAQFEWKSLLPMVLMMVALYVLFIMPQQKKIKSQKELVSKLKKGDRVLTSSGIIGVVYDHSNEEEIKIEISRGVVIEVPKAYITQVYEKSSPFNQKSLRVEDQYMTEKPNLNEKKEIKVKDAPAKKASKVSAVKAPKKAKAPKAAKVVKVAKAPKVAKQKKTKK